MSKLTTNKNSKLNSIYIDDGFFHRFNEMLSTLGISQNEFARSIDSTSAFISNIARGKAKPGLEFLQKIATTFDVSLDWLVLGKGSVHGKTYIEPEWFHTVRLRVELAKQIQQGSQEAKKLAEELLNDKLSSNSSASERLQLFDQLSHLTTNDSILVMLYNLYSSNTDQEKRAKNVLQEAIRQFESKVQDPLAQLIQAQQTHNKEVSSKPDREQHISGSNNRVAGGDYHE